MAVALGIATGVQQLAGAMLGASWCIASADRRTIQPALPLRLFRELPATWLLSVNSARVAGPVDLRLSDRVRRPLLFPIRWLYLQQPGTESIRPEQDIVDQLYLARICSGHDTIAIVLYAQPDHRPDPHRPDAKWRHGKQSLNHSMDRVLRTAHNGADAFVVGVSRICTTSPGCMSLADQRPWVVYFYSESVGERGVLETLRETGGGMDRWR